MRGDRPSEQQLRRNFDTLLADVLAGEGVRTASGLDSPTEAALWAIAKAYPNVSEDLVTAARAAFAGQLDGSNAARWRADIERLLAERKPTSNS
ncbi:hypothetical protein D7D52_28225 [Nocardia yunnanensis]|uniref:Uncharacterized protein n=1 Tax=Nocardia yunnanensis TaxID=2382165 RepID=A0A386ZIK3_9NOCA|nr:hypothetical protein [Nocardia yunnanensis]AYF77053.1 hypothetical protein D7D52_28225 [Nocardia yunnanensis]